MTSARPDSPTSPPLRSAGDSFFASQPTQGFRWLPWAWIGLLFILGLFFWGYFFHWGQVNFNYQDWAEVSAARIAFVQDSIVKGVLPLHMPDSSALRGLTDRFFVIPDVAYSPQMLLLGVMSVGQFVLVNTLLFYSLGVMGLLWLRRRFQLSLAAYTLLFLMFGFNGYIQSHLSIGHANWVVYFLFPWLIVLSIQLLDAPRGWRWIAATAFLLFFILINGGFHQYIWGLMFLGLLGLAAYRRFLTVLKALVFAGLLGAVRLLPPTLGMGSFDHDFITGYPSLRLLVSGLFSLVGPQQAYAMRSSIHYTGFWELDLYLGIAGGLLLLYFGGWQWLRNNLGRRQFPQLWLPVVVLGVLSLDSLYKPIQALPFPFFNAERVSSRMIVLPFLVAAVLGAINYQRLLDQIRTGWLAKLIRYASLAALLILAFDLCRHAALWQLGAAYQAFDVTPVNLAIKTIANHPDPAYTRLLVAGGALSLLAGLFLIGMAWREHRKSQSRLSSDDPREYPISASPIPQRDDSTS